MYIKRYYSLWMTIKWSRKSLLYGTLYSAAVIVVYELTHIPFALPWQPISVIGIAVAFFLSFKNNSSYDRTWEARKIWGRIINESRTFATAILSMPGETLSYEGKKIVVHRHLAWLLALKHNMRKTRTWEHNGPLKELVFTPKFRKECEDGMEPEVSQYLSVNEFVHLKKYNNIPSQILKNQSLEIARLFNSGHLSDYKHVWLHKLIGNLYDLQGMTERIKISLSHVSMLLPGYGLCTFFAPLFPLVCSTFLNNPVLYIIGLPFPFLR